MSHDLVDQALPLELIAISTGSATARDLRSSFEWRIYETGRDAYYSDNWGQTIIYEPAWMGRKGKMALLSDVGMAFSEYAAGIDLLDRNTQATLAEIEQRCSTKRNETAQRMTERYPRRVVSTRYSPGDWFETRKEVLGVKAGDDVDGSRSNRELKPARTRWMTVKRMIKNGFFFVLSRNHSATASHRPTDDSVCEFYNVL